MKDYDTIFLDRDGTINPDPGYISMLDDFQFFDFTISSLKKLADGGNRFCIVTNQSGIDRGLIKQRNLDEIHTFIQNEFQINNIPLLGIYVCTDHPEQATERRKPGPGLFTEAAQDNNINLKKSLMIGDSIADIEGGNKLGMETMLVLTGCGNQTKKTIPDEIQPTFVVSSLQEGASILLGECR